MSLGLDTVDPTDVAALQRAVDESDPGGRLARIGMSRIEIDRDALAILPDAVARIAGGGPVAILMDRTPMRRNGDDLKQLVATTLARDFDVTVCSLEASGGELHADEKAIAQAESALGQVSCVVALGSGTITDIAKEATARLGNLPLVVVQTAASVNAFSDNMAVVLQAGVKRTVSSRWPDVLLIDLEVLASAPAGMNLAGFGDLLAVWTAPADWWLASLLGMDTSYHISPVHLLRGHGEQLLRTASTLRQDPLAGLDRLANTLTLSGIALGIAGSTAPLSGTEHLISHLIDMRLSHDHQPLRLHGAQVGLAVVIAAELWAEFLSGFDAGAVDVAGSFPPEAEVEPVVLRAFADLDPSGGLGRECWRDCRRKLQRWSGCRPGLESLVRDWDSRRPELAAALRSPEELVGALRDAGAVSKFSDLAPPLPVDAVRWAVERLPFMRDRFTLADLLFYTGRWNGRLVDGVLRRSQELGVVA